MLSEEQVKRFKYREIGSEIAGNLYFTIGWIGLFFHLQPLVLISLALKVVREALQVSFSDAILLSFFPILIFAIGYKWAPTQTSLEGGLLALLIFSCLRRGLFGHGTALELWELKIKNAQYQNELVELHKPMSISLIKKVIFNEYFIILVVIFVAVMSATNEEIIAGWNELRQKWQ